MCNRLAPLALAFLLTAAACDSTQAPREAIPPVAFQTIVEGPYGSYDFKERRNLVIHNRADFQAFWQALHSNDPSPPPVPEVDFSEFTVVAALLGTKPSGGYAIEIAHLAFDADPPVHVRVETTVPGKRCGVTTALTSPYHIIKVGGADLDFTFEDERVVHQCGD